VRRDFGLDFGWILAGFWPDFGRVIHAKSRNLPKSVDWNYSSTLTSPIFNK
jgi:hypothetical protein